MYIVVPSDMAIPMSQFASLTGVVLVERQYDGPEDPRYKISKHQHMEMEVITSEQMAIVVAKKRLEET